TNNNAYIGIKRGMNTQELTCANTFITTLFSDVPLGCLIVLCILSRFVVHCCSLSRLTMQLIFRRLMPFFSPLLQLLQIEFSLLDVLKLLLQNLLTWILKRKTSKE